MDYLSLDGEWTLKAGTRADDVPGEIRDSNLFRTGIPATVPGCVHTDLLDAGLIDDPYYRDNELSVLWVGETDWTYRRTFRLDEAFVSSGPVELVCSGLDTLAEIRINGTRVGETDNAFRSWRFPIDTLLSVGENEITVLFTAPVPWARDANEQNFYWHTGMGAERLPGVNHLRKSQANFGWDWGPRLATSGIWKRIGLEALESGRLDDVDIRQTALDDDAAELSVGVSCNGAQDGTTVRVRAKFSGDDVAVATAGVSGCRAELSLHIAEPRRWWPNGAGPQHRYSIVAELLDTTGAPVDRCEKCIGLRTLRLVREPDDWGESFYFEVNGYPLFAKGANWIPADTLVTRVEASHYRRLLRSAADAHMNMLRVWGGGIYEYDLFYDLCDELGIMVWQDFMFACGAYPAARNEFLENVKAEAREQIRRLRHHPSIALWCGNNELEQIHPCIGDGEDARAAGSMTWDSYEHLFDSLLPDLVAELQPDTAYWPSSPHTPGAKRGDANDPHSGDAHLWMVWHGRQPFEAYRECEHRFNSEFGFQSFPEPAAVAQYAAPGERNITSRIMEHHQRSPIGNDTIVQYMLEWFQLPVRSDMVLWTAQILQGLAITYAVEHWRRSVPRGMGTLYWQLNDCWPVASWSGIDWQGRWKALHYMMMRAYAPLLVSSVENPEKGTITLFVTSDELSPCETRLEWRMWTVDGEIIALGEEDVDVPASGTVEVLTLEFEEQIEQLGAHNLIFFAELFRGETRESDAVATFVRPKHLELRNPALTVRRNQLDGNAESWKLSVERPALWVWPDMPGYELRYSDRFFHLEPDRPREVIVGPENGQNTDWHDAEGRVYSLFDTARERE